MKIKKNKNKSGYRRDDLFILNCIEKLFVQKKGVVDMEVIGKIIIVLVIFFLILVYIVNRSRQSEEVSASFLDMLRSMFSGNR